MFWPNRIANRCYRTESVETDEGATWEQKLSISCVWPSRKLQKSKADHSLDWGLFTLRTKRSGVGLSRRVANLFHQLWSSTIPYQLNAGVRLQRR
jgi:hypothetical protein